MTLYFLSLLVNTFQEFLEILNSLNRWVQIPLIREWGINIRWTFCGGFPLGAVHYLPSIPGRMNLDRGTKHLTGARPGNEAYGVPGYETYCCTPDGGTKHFWNLEEISSDRVCRVKNEPPLIQCCSAWSKFHHSHNIFLSSWGEFPAGGLAWASILFFYQKPCDPFSPQSFLKMWSVEPSKCLTYRFLIFL